MCQLENAEDHSQDTAQDDIQIKHGRLDGHMTREEMLLDSEAGSGLGEICQSGSGYLIYDDFHGGKEEEEFF
jgi:hypothetical protein